MPCTFAQRLRRWMDVDAEFTTDGHYSVNRGKCVNFGSSMDSQNSTCKPNSQTSKDRATQLSHLRAIQKFIHVRVSELFFHASWCRHRFEVSEQKSHNKLFIGDQACPRGNKILVRFPRRSSE